MAKRFIDTNLFNDEFFMNLSKDSKLFYIYCFTNCDHAGIIKLNKKLCSFQTDIKDLDNCIKELSNRLVTVSKDLDNIYFLPKFLIFQYPNFPKSKVKQQESALKILNEYGIDYNSYITVSKELPNYYDNGNDNDNVNVLWIKSFKRNPSIVEYEETEKLINKFSLKIIQKTFMEAGLRNIKSLATVIKYLDDKGNLLSYDEYNSIKEKPIKEI